MIELTKSWHFVEAIEQAENVASVATVLMNIAEQFGFTSVFGGLMPTRSEPRPFAHIRPLVMVQHFPAEWTERYNDGGYLFRDPIFHRLQNELNPFTWRESYATSHSKDDVKLIQNGAADYGLMDGYVVPVTTLDGRLAAVSFGGNNVELSPAEAMALNFAVSFATGHFLKLQTAPSLAEPPMTIRESECLLWAGEGKTDWEISMIMGISRSTVLKHVASAREKLGAVNKTHAVALAMRRKILK